MVPEDVKYDFSANEAILVNFPELMYAGSLLPTT